MPVNITLRPIRSEDDAFLGEVYASTRSEELAVVDWSDAEKAGFLRMQFDAQHKHYRTHFPEAEFNVILLNGQPAGRLYVLRSANEFRVIDIALLPQHRNAGIGTALLRDILTEAAIAAKPVHIRVESMNPARRLYERLGFSLVEEGPIYAIMEKHP